MDWSSQEQNKRLLVKRKNKNMIRHFNKRDEKKETMRNDDEMTMRVIFLPIALLLKTFGFYRNLTFKMWLRLFDDFYI